MRGYYTVLANLLFSDPVAGSRSSLPPTLLMVLVRRISRRSTPTLMPPSVKTRRSSLPTKHRTGHLSQRNTRASGSHSSSVGPTSRPRSRRSRLERMPPRRMKMRTTSNHIVFCCTMVLKLCYLHVMYCFTFSVTFRLFSEPKKTVASHSRHHSHKCPVPLWVFRHHRGYRPYTGTYPPR
jgi:hypothetical protein